MCVTKLYGHMFTSIIHLFTAHAQFSSPQYMTIRGPTPASHSWFTVNIRRKHKQSTRWHYAFTRPSLCFIHTLIRPGLSAWRSQPPVWSAASWLTAPPEYRSGPRRWPSGKWRSPLTPGHACLDLPRNLERTGGKHEALTRYVHQIKTFFINVQNMLDLSWSHKRENKRKHRDKPEELHSGPRGAVLSHTPINTHIKYNLSSSSLFLFC